MDAPSQSERDESPTPSPTDTRTHPSRYETIVRGDNSAVSDSQMSTDTVRRRPEAGYGTMQSSQQSTGSQYLGESGAHERARSRTGTSTHSQSIRSPMLAPERARGRGRKQGIPHRASSTVQVPHRGEVFSIDDDPDEVETDAAAGRQQIYTSESTRGGPSTLRRRTTTTAMPTLTRKVSSRSDVLDDDGLEDASEDERDNGEGPSEDNVGGITDDTIVPGDNDEEAEDEEDGDISDAESFTLKDRQQAINETHPFGIRIWKPALYKKDRSVQKNAEGDIHSTPGGQVNRWLVFFNIVWTLAFGWWMAFFAALGAVTCFIFAAAPSSREYGRVLWGLSGYLFYPFGKFVRLEQDEAYLDEDQGEGRSISEYEQWQSGDLEYGRLFFGPDRNRSIIGRSRRSIDSEPSETDSLLERSGIHSPNEPARQFKRRLFGRGQWNIGRVIFFLVFYGLLTPSLFIVSGICWFLVFWIPMGKVTMLLFYHLRRHPLALSFDSDIATARLADARHSSILVCTYRAVGLKYWKYTIDGTNIFLINLMVIVGFVIFDWLVLDSIFHVDNFITHPGFLFVMGIFSIIPLAYFIGQAVASISAQSSMGLGAVINAFFSTIVEVFLYCVALRQGKAQLVEGSIIGSIFAGILFLPGLSMCFGALRRKTQRFNARSAGVTSTMLLFAVIAAFGPTLFYQIYGTHELNCLDCTSHKTPFGDSRDRDCRRCYFSQTPALDDRFYIEAVRPFCYAAAVLLFLSYMIGLWFTLRTHAAVIWNTEIDEKKQEDPQPRQPTTTTRVSDPRSFAEASGADIRDSHLYKRILGQSLKQVGLQGIEEDPSRPSTAVVQPNGSARNPYMVPPKGSDSGPDSIRNVHIPGFSEAENDNLVRGVTELAAAAAAIAARDARNPRRIPSQQPAASTGRPTPARSSTYPVDGEEAEEQGEAHGHDAPNWSRLKSSIILCGATVLYAIIAEILVDTVDVVLQSVKIDEKFLGITLFALVPNTTEFLNGISFAMNGNIALSMEIGSAYALQVCLLQIPALVLFSAVYPIVPLPSMPDPSHYTFSLLFPQWDMVTVILCVFMLSYMYGEGKSNYFKGSILLLSYAVVAIGFYFSGMTDIQMGPNRFDTMAADGSWTSYKTVGRGTRGLAWET